MNPPTPLAHYKVFDPPIQLEFGKWTRREARDYFGWFVKVIEDRVAILREVVGSTHPDCRLDMSPDSLFCLGEFLAEHVATRPKTPMEKEEDRASLPEKLAKVIRLNEWELTDLTISLCIDAGIYLAETLRSHYPDLAWTLWTRKTAEFHRPVLCCFQGEVPLEPVLVLGNLGRGWVSGTENPTALREVFEVWSAKMAGN